MIDLTRAREIAEEWLSAWNAHDLERVLSHYADALEFVSPLVIRRLDRKDGMIRSKRELRDYFAQSLGPNSDLRFDLIDVLAGVSSVGLVYRNHRGQTVAETMVLNGDGKVTRVFVHHRGD